ncbi:MAG: GNAT family N-acetyltransferase [Deltaproteobacteria bacterium]|nr:GNAT family N-acetyltransferase [Deltaproteobacteria bacterium]
MGDSGLPRLELAGLDDLPAILDLQKLAFWGEAQALGDFSITPLSQTLSSLRSEFEQGPVLVAREEGGLGLVGSVRAREEADSVYVAKLFVHPERQNRGLGRALLAAVEKLFGPKTYALFTTEKSHKNLRLYRLMGYREFKREKWTDEEDFVFLKKEVV